MSRTATLRQSFTDNEIRLIYLLERKGFVVMRWFPDGIMRVLSEELIITWNIKNSEWSSDAGRSGTGVGSMITHLKEGKF